MVRSIAVRTCRLPIAETYAERISFKQMIERTIEIRALTNLIDTPTAMMLITIHSVPATVAFATPMSRRFAVEESRNADAVQASVIPVKSMIKRCSASRSVWRQRSRYAAISLVRT
jgi:hypothetical protein